MRFIKVFLIGLIGLFIIVTLISLVIPSDVKLSHAVIINSTTGKIYAQIGNLKNWKNWQPIFASDSAVITFSNSDMGSNTNCDITYKNRRINIATTSLDPTSIRFILKSNGEDDIENEISITPVNAQNSVRVEWRALTKLHWYPWEKFYGIFIDRITGPGYDEALNNLKRFVEAAH
jgi:hypothetical protein